MPMPSAINGLETGGFDLKRLSTAYYWISKNWFAGGFFYRWRNSEHRNTFSLTVSIRLRCQFQSQSNRHTWLR